jgi:hypothetical protein
MWDDEDEDYSHVTPRDCSCCGNPIPLARLDAVNTAFCVKCVDRTQKIVHDPEIICAKASPSGQNGWSPTS